MSAPAYDAVVVGAGPNGLAAAITLAQSGRSVLVLEGNDTVGGGARSAELTLPGFVHDVCSAIHPLALASPCFRELPLDEHGLEFLHPEICQAHPLDNGKAVLLYRDLERTCESLGPDAGAYRRFIEPFVRTGDALMHDVLGSLRIPRHPLTLARFGLTAGLRSANSLAKSKFDEEPARALFAGWAGHSMLSLDRLPTGALGVVFGVLAHTVGWPAAKGGSQSISEALASYARLIGVEIETGRVIADVDELPPHRVVLLDVTPRQLHAIAGARLPARYLRALTRYRYGPGVFKMDWALDGPVPWASQVCARAGTVHVGGTMDEIAAGEDEVSLGKHPEKPFLILAQQSAFDARAPEGKHTLWGYCHVPNGSDVDMTERIEAQIERFAPGFRDRILARAVMGPRAVETYNPNYVGGDINGGAQDFGQLFTRPVARLVPYSTPNPGIYLCSSSTPPGGGVHGMCGYLAAKAVIKRTGQ